MNQKQLIIRDFLEIVLFENFDYDQRDHLYDIVSNTIFDNGDYLGEFCDFVGLGQGFAEVLETVDFPFLDWWDDYCQRFEQECEENAREEAEFHDDYMRMVGAK